MNPFADLGHRLYALRTKHGWTQQELAERVNRTRFRPDVKQPHIAGLERSAGEKLPSVPLLAALAEVFEMDMQTLVGLEHAQVAPADLLDGLSEEDKILAAALISRLRDGADALDADWRRLSRSVMKTGGREMAASIENELGVFLETGRN